MRRWLPFLIAAVIIALDHWTKTLIRARVDLYSSFTVIPGYFNIVHAENPGIAFSMLADAPGVWRDALLIGFAAAVVIGISAMLLRRATLGDACLRTALGLILGGACGNLYDRIVSRTVTDFVEVHAGQHYFPAFNVADSAITVGACLLLLDAWRTKERKGSHVSEAGLDR